MKWGALEALVCIWPLHWLLGPIVIQGPGSDLLMQSFRVDAGTRQCNANVRHRTQFLGCLLQPAQFHSQVMGDNVFESSAKPLFTKKIRVQIL